MSRAAGVRPAPGTGQAPGGLHYGWVMLGATLVLVTMAAFLSTRITRPLPSSAALAPT